MQVLRRNAPRSDFLSEARKRASQRYEGKHNFVGQRGDKAVSLAREIGSGAFHAPWKRRDDRQPAVVEGFSLRGKQSQCAEASRKHHHDRLFAAMEDVEALILNRSVRGTRSGK